MLPGVYSCSFVFAGDDWFNGSSDDLSFTIDKSVSDLIASLDDDYRFILLNLTSDGVGVSNKTISVVIGDDSFDVLTDDSGVYSIDISGLVPGVYSCSFVFAGDDWFNGSSDDLSFTIDKIGTELDSKNTIGDVGSVYLSSSLTSDGKGIKGQTISLDIGGKTLTNVTNDEGIAIFDLSNLDAGYYDAELTFAGNEIYKNSSIKVEVTINKLNVDLSSEFKDKKLNLTLMHDHAPVEFMNINVEIKGNGSNNLATFNAITDKDGVAIVDLNDLESGNYTAVIKVMGDKKYDAKSDKLNFTIDAEEIIPSKEIRTAADLQKLIDDAKSGDIIDLGEYEYVNVSDINITKDIVLLGNNTTISTAGDGKAVFNIAKDLDNVEITGIDFNVNNGDVIAKATAQNGTDPLSIDVPAIKISNNSISGDEKLVPESITILELDSERPVLAPNNEISIVNNTLESGIKPFEFKVSNFENDSSANIPVVGDLTSKKATVLHYEDMTTTAVNQKIEGRAGKYFEVNLTDDAGNPLSDKKVQIGFNGAIYNRTTNATGGVKLQINLGYKGTYTFAVSYLGDESYNGSFIVAKIVVNTQKTKLTTSTKTYKASAKTKTLTATLKDASGHAISGKKVSFTVNGKSYSATTNAKGVATVKVSLSTKKTYSFTAKYTGDDMYTASSASGKVTIK